MSSWLEAIRSAIKSRKNKMIEREPTNKNEAESNAEASQSLGGHITISRKDLLCALYWADGMGLNEAVISAGHKAPSGPMHNLIVLMIAFKLLSPDLRKTMRKFLQAENGD